MSVAGFPVGQEMNVTYPDFKVSLQLQSVTQMSFDIADGPFAHKETVSIQVQPLSNGIFLVSWVEESGATVTNVQDFDRGIVHSFVTLPGGRFLRMVGSIEVTRPADLPSDDRPERNKALVLDAMTALFQQRENIGIGLEGEDEASVAGIQARHDRILAAIGPDIEQAIDGEAGEEPAQRLHLRILVDAARRRQPHRQQPIAQFAAIAAHARCSSTR